MFSLTRGGKTQGVRLQDRRNELGDQLGHTGLVREADVAEGAAGSGFQSCFYTHCVWWDLGHRASGRLRSSSPEVPWEQPCLSFQPAARVQGNVICDESGSPSAGWSLSLLIAYASLARFLWK